MSKFIKLHETITRGNGAHQNPIARPSMNVDLPSSNLIQFVYSLVEASSCMQAMISGLKPVVIYKKVRKKREKRGLQYILKY